MAASGEKPMAIDTMSRGRALVAPDLDAKPVKIASPLFDPSAWPSYYGQVAWADQFSWLSP